MNAAEFVNKWSRSTLGERSAAQQHFLDLCELLDHPKPAAEDPTGEEFTFEKGAAKHGGGDGWADVWKRGFFGWEYKGKHKDLAAAYDQLLLYREAIENPPLLVVCDMERIVVHTNFTNTSHDRYEILLADLGTPRNLEILRSVFFAPEKLRPGATSEAITAEAASRVATIAQSLRGRGLSPPEVAQFLDRVVFALFAEDIGLLTPGLFSRLLANCRREPALFPQLVGDLFAKMTSGGFFGNDRIRRFNGNLFTNGPVVALLRDEIDHLVAAAKLDWSAVDPSILGTLFERGMDPDKRSQLGAHYTSREDIETLVDPVVMQPLRREWAEAQRIAKNFLATGKREPKPSDSGKALEGAALKKARAEALVELRAFHERLCEVKVLDPACGSGNFLFVTLQKLKDLEKEVLVYLMDLGFPGLFPRVGPLQLYGIEVNPYAFELAQMSVWIGYLQWTKNNGFGEPDDPVLKPMDTFRNMDAILDLSDPENPKEPEWPAVDFIVGNPPFLGNKLIRRLLGDPYAERLWSLYADRAPAASDLCCYWFEKARQQIQLGKCHRAGLLATQGIRGGANREVLKRIKETGDIFFAISDRAWILEGANVHVSLVAFDSGMEKEKTLDHFKVPSIHSDLTSASDLTTVRKLRANKLLSFQGPVRVGDFDISYEEFIGLLHAPNPHGRPNSEVLRPTINGNDITKRTRDRWVIDFDSLPESSACLFEAPFALVNSRVKPFRSESRDRSRKERWWLHGRTGDDIRAAAYSLPRYIGMCQTAKYFLWRFIASVTSPEQTVIIVARADDESLGLLESHIHNLWAMHQGTRLETRPRYTPTTCFETFPFPRPTPAQESAIAAAAKDLNELRSHWLNPLEWTKTEILEFPGSTKGPWARYLHDADSRGIGTVRWPRIVAKDDEHAEKLKTRTLTNLYNQRPAWLDLAHKKLDGAVFAAYGWPVDLSEEEILERLLALNLERAREEGQGEPR